MSVSYQIRQEVNAQVLIWAVAGGVVRLVRVAGSVGRVAAFLALAALDVATVTSVLLWDCRPSRATVTSVLAVAGKTLVLSSVLVAAVIAVNLVQPVIWLCLGGIAVGGVVTYPR